MRGQLLMKAWLAGAAVAGCASTGSTTATPPVTAAPVEGRYDYVANLPGQQVRGTMTVAGDTVVVNPVTDYCRPTVRAPDPLAIHYTCNGPGSYEQIQLRIDRRNPVQLSKWTATFRVQKRREVCQRYALQNGRQVCVETTTETYEATESRSGSLVVRKAQ